jgi:glycosyltransferase involved in cell wall biosynthesis
VTISALMVTPAALTRRAMLDASLACLRAQTRPVDELVVVAAEPHAGTGELERVVASVNTSLRIVPGPAGASLGALRNLSVATATGDILCQWDDDDLPHPERIARQLDAMGDAAAVYLSDVWQWFPATRELYWTTYRRLPHACHPGTGMFRASHAPRYPELSRGEDTAACLDLRSRQRVALIEGAPDLFVYVSHGANTWAADHHRMLARELGLSRGLLRRRADAVAASLGRIEIGDEPASVMGSNGLAFTWHPARLGLDQ